MIDVKSVSLMDLLPHNIRSDPAVETAARSIDHELQTVTNEIFKLCYFTRFSDLTEEETNELAWRWNVDFYDSTLPLEKRREMIKKSYAWHRRKGTPSAVEEFISTVFADAEVKEWFEYDGQPYHFKVQTREIVTPEKYDYIVRAINSVKNARSVLDDIETNRGFEQKIELSSTFSRLSYRFQGFAGLQTLTGTLNGGPTVVISPTPPVYINGTLEASGTYETKQQAAYAITGLIYAGSSGVMIAPIIKPDDQFVTYDTSALEANGSVEIAIQQYSAPHEAYYLNIVVKPEDQLSSHEEELNVSVNYSVSTKIYKTVGTINTGTGELI